MSKSSEMLSVKATDLGRALMHFALPDGDNPYIGCLVTVDPRGKLLRKIPPYYKGHIFEITGIQMGWGYNEKGEYTLIRMYRVRNVTQEFDDYIGVPKAHYHLKFLCTNEPVPQP